MSLATNFAVLFPHFVLIIGLVATAVTGSHQWEDEKHESPQPYRFGYEVKDKEGSQYRHEEADGHGSVKGSYGYTDKKGVYREVHYVADKDGFRAKVKTNEPGTANQDPAAVKIEAEPQIQEVHGVHVVPKTVPVYHKSPASHNHVPVYREHVKSYHKPQFVKQYQKINSDKANVDHYSPLHGFSYKPSFDGKLKSHFGLDKGFKKHDGRKIGSYKFRVPHYRNLNSYSDDHSGSPKFDAEIQKILDELKSKGRYADGQNGFEVDHDEIERMIEELKNKARYSGNLKQSDDFDFKEFRHLGLNKDKSLFDKDFKHEY